MADVFISYYKPDHALTKALADDLKAAGFSVWWDTALLGDDQFRDVIDREIDLCTRAIIIWTPQSVKRRWVLSEADHALRLDKLINTVALGQAPNLLPKPFGQIHAIPLEDRDTIIKTLHRAVSQRGNKALAEKAASEKALDQAYPIAATDAVLAAAGRLMKLADREDWNDDLQHYADVLSTAAEDMIEAMTAFAAEASFNSVTEFDDRVWLKQVLRTMEDSRRTLEKELRWLGGSLTRAVILGARNDLHYSAVQLKDACQRK